MSRFAIATPYFIVVVCLIVAVLGVNSIASMPVDMFPAMNIPVVIIATFYSGMAPEQIEVDITSRLERYFTLAPGVDHIESRSLPGVSVIKVYFQLGTDVDSDTSSISNLAMANLRRLPPGTLPPLVMKFDASSLPVCLITLKGEGLNEIQLRDIAQYNIRNQIASVPGSSVPQPFGGAPRQIMVYSDPYKLEAHQLSPMDIVRAINEGNLILPAGDVPVGRYDYNIYTNSQLATVGDIDQVPVKMEGLTPVRVADIGKAMDAKQIQTNVVRVDGQRSVYLPILKQGGDSNTIAVVDGMREALKHLVDIPKQLVGTVVFDQSKFVKTAIETLLHEGAIGLFLTSIMILVFLGSFRATVAVFFSIPLSALATFMVLAMGGGTINSMMLGGLALAFSRLIDNSVVVLENIYRHLELGETPEVAAAKGGREVALAVLAATLTTAVVFFPVTLLYGVSKYLFSALALAVVISLGASYMVAMTVVPLFCARFIKKPHHSSGGFNHWFNGRFEAFLNLYDKAVNFVLNRPGQVLTVFGVLFALTALLLPLLGVSFFPRTDPGQFMMNVKLASGTRIEVTEKEIARVEQLVRDVVPPSELELIVSNLGSTPDFSALYTPNSGTHTAFVQVSLKDGHKTGSYEYMERVRKKLSEQMPEVTAYFQSGGLVDAVLNAGMPAPIDVQVAGSNLNRSYNTALELAAKIRKIPGVAELYIPQNLDYPTLKLNIDRIRAGQLGLDQKEIVSNVITALTSNGMIAPTYWIDPKTGSDYMLTVQYPENQIRNLDDLQAIPIRAGNASEPSRIDAVGSLTRMTSPTEVDHYQIRRIVDVYVRNGPEDLGRIASAIDKVIAQTKIPDGVDVTLRGIVQGMRTSFRSFGAGLLLSVVLLYLIMVAQFRSFADPMLILVAVPPGMMGILMTLVLTDTTLNVMSLMGIVMFVGISASDSILIVEFTTRLREEGMSVRAAVALACRVRLRPVLMTSLATLIGLLPMALKLGEGSESYAPLARVVVGGLLMSMMFTVLLVPAAYYLYYRKDDLNRPDAGLHGLEQAHA
ncbi:MAG TPA: efflux RND transporter permease subunit [Bryobacteraceae bacterium]